MSENKGLFMLLLTIAIIGFVHIGILVLNDGIKTAGEAMFIEGTSASTVYGFLKNSEFNPREYTVVFGRYATPFEKEAAIEIAQSLGTRIVAEGDVFVQRRLILFGKPGTNLLLDKLLPYDYDEGQVTMFVEGNNLLVIVNDEIQASLASESIIHYELNKKQLLSPTATIQGRYTLAYLLGLTILLIVIVVLLHEKIRRKGISKAMETSETHKIDALRDYIAKYKSEGYDIVQIKKWLVNYGYEKELVERAVQKDA